MRSPRLIFSLAAAMLHVTAAVYANPACVLSSRAWRPTYSRPERACLARLLRCGDPRKPSLRLRGGFADEAEEAHEEEETQIRRQEPSYDWLDEYLPEHVRKEWCVANRMQTAEEDAVWEGACGTHDQGCSSCAFGFP